MKHKLLYLLLAMATLASACIKNTTETTSTPEPSGTFTGQYTMLHRALGATKIDTPQKAIVTITLTSATHLFTVTGDTTVHAGSLGSYSVSSPFITFIDKTYPKTGVPVKTHLYGIYQYYYDGSNVFQMLGGNDTVNVEYDLKKVTTN